MNIAIRRSQPEKLLDAALASGYDNSPRFIAVKLDSAVASHASLGIHNNPPPQAHAEGAAGRASCVQDTSFLTKSQEVYQSARLHSPAPEYRDMYPGVLV